MKKLFFTLALMMTSSIALASDQSVKITSFTYTASGSKVAELCGTVSNVQTTPTFVQVTVDYQTKRPAIYNTIANAEGKFCLTVVTYRGTAEAKVL